MYGGMYSLTILNKKLNYQDNMEDIRKKAKDNELNLEKGEDIHKQPRKFIPVPKVKDIKKKVNHG